MVLSGTDAVIFDTSAAIAEPGVKVLVQGPEYPPLRNVAEWKGAEVETWRPDSDGTWNTEATVGADIVVICAPYSPFGSCPSEGWLRSLAQSTEASGQILCVDEIYRGIDLTADGSGLPPSACELSSAAVVFGGLAKTFGMPGLRLGWLVCRVVATRGRIRRLSQNVNTNCCAPTELLGAIALEHSATLLERNAQVARGNLECVAGLVERSEGLFSWTRPTAGLVAWLWWHGPGSALELAQSVLQHEFIMVTYHTLFGVEDTARGGGLRLGLGMVDTPARLAKLEAAVQRFVRSREASPSL
jgi:aspartate/methionine/tyrosine aminotransferase